MTDYLKLKILVLFTAALLFFSLVVILEMSGCKGQYKPDIPAKGKYHTKNSILIDMSDIPAGYCLTSMVKKDDEPFAEMMFVDCNKLRSNP